MIERQRSDIDRRQTNVVLTEKGRKAVEGAPDPLQQKYVEKFEALADWEQAMIVAALERVAAMLNASEMDASPVLDMGGSFIRPTCRTRLSAGERRPAHRSADRCSALVFALAILP